MTPEELSPYLGTACNVRLRCRACGGRHLLYGTLRPGRYIGEVGLVGYSYSVEDIEAIWGALPPARRRPRWPRLRHVRRPGLAMGGRAW